MSESQVIELMTRVEAAACLEAIRGRVLEACEMALAFDQRMGWKALGYPTLRACFEAELGTSWQHGYRLLARGDVQQSIRQLANDDTITVRENWIRGTGLRELEPSKRAEAYTLALQIASTEGDKQIVKRHIEQAVRQINARDEVFKSTYAVITNLVVTGKITPKRGREMSAAVDELLPRRRGYVVQLIAKYGLGMNDASIIVPVGNMFERQPGKESRVLPEVQTGYLAGVPLAKATATDLGKANAEAAREHREDGAPSVNVEPKIITVYVGDNARTYKALIEALGAANMESFERYVLSK